MESMKTLSFHAGANFDSRRLQCKAGESDYCGMGEGFRVDDLLDFSNDDIGGPIGDDCTSLSNHSNDSTVTVDETFTSQVTEKGCARAPHMSQELGSPSEAGLCVPSDELADLLGWLSNFVEDSYSTDETHGPLLTSSNASLGNEKSKVSTMSRGTSLSPSSSVVEESTTYSRRPWTLSSIRFVPVRARSKRSRTGGLVWSHHTLVPAFSENGTGTDISGDSQVYSSEEEVNDSVRPAKREPKAKQPKKSMDVSHTRRCTHCQAQKTPQWRAGPMGPKTLCNACGVRYKSGRLLPEYRPVASPSFSSEMHSNSHRRIMEMRRQQEQEPPMSQQQHSESMQIVSKEDPDTIICRDEDKECNLTDEIQQ